MRDIQDLLEGLKRTPNVLSEFVKTIPEGKMDLRRGEGFWTIAEHVSHLAQVQPVILERFQRFMNEDHPEFVPFIPGSCKSAPVLPPRLDMTAALDQFARYRNKELLLLEGADDMTWQKTGAHPEYEYYSLFILTRHVLMHDYWHMYRMEELWLTRDAYLTRLE
ncbi:MAG: DinB family protein [Deltaproteobacteria bacterium]|nr:DinB family protein [Deltaproteobacteria bacterium]